MSENRIKLLREKHNLTQKQAAEALGYHTTTYARWEQEVHQIKLIDAINIAKFYNVSIDYIAELTDIEEPYRKENSSSPITINQKHNTNAVVNIETKK